jgi:foldase protein PrsA
MFKKGIAKILAGLTIFSVIGAGLAGCSLTDKTVATVGNEKIPMSKYEEYLNINKQMMKNQKIDWNQKMNGKTFKDIFRENTINSLVDMTIMKQEAEKAGIKVTQADIDKAKKNFPDVKSQDFYKDDALVNKFYESQAKDAQISDSDLKSLYDQNKSMFLVADVNVIYTKSQDDANKALSEIKAGKGFADAAKQYSIDKVSKDKGGDLGEQPLMTFSSVLSYDLNNTPENQPVLITGKNSDKNVYAVVMLKNKQLKSFDQVKDILKQQKLNQIAQAKINDIMQKDKEKENIKIDWSAVYSVDI